jgi:NAD(P)H-dependent FMN reductase
VRGKIVLILLLKLSHDRQIFYHLFNLKDFMKILLFSGSLRTGSFNKKLVAVANGLLSQKAEIKTQVADLKSLAFPVYDGDIEAAGIPKSVTELGDLVAWADAIVISSPEYNASIAGSLKNTIDWVSRLRPNRFEGKPILLMGASPGYFGAIRALGVSKAPFETLGAYVFPQTFALPKAGEAFSPTGELVEEANQKKLGTLLDSFLAFAQKFSKPS